MGTLTGNPTPDRIDSQALALTRAVSPGKTSDLWESCEVSWDDLTQTGVKDCRRKEDAFGWVFGWFRWAGTRGRRRASLMAGRSALVLDYDAGDSKALDLVLKALRRLGVAAIIYSSASHTKADPRFRVVVPLAEPMRRDFGADPSGKVLSARVMAAHGWLAELLGHPHHVRFDENAMSGVHFHYEPVKPTTKDESPIWEVVTGRAVLLDELPEPSPDDPNVPHVNEIEPGDFTDWERTRAHDQLKEWTRGDELPDGERKPYLDKYLRQCWNYEAGGLLTHEEITDAFLNILPARYETSANWRDLLKRDYPKRIPEAPHGDPSRDFANIDDVFWGSRPALEHVQTFATARLTPPWAVLGSVLARAICEAPPNVVLPPIVGSPASLNLNVANVARSGDGKSVAQSVARDCFLWGQQRLMKDRVKLGSGEGIVHQYARMASKKEFENGDAGPDGMVWETDTVLFVAEEIDAVAAVSARSGSTLMSELRSAFMGERLGFAYSSKDKRVSLPPRQYRFCLVGNVQPLRSQSLFGDADGGTPQRFLWMSSTLDPKLTLDDIPDVPDPIPLPQIDWTKSGYWGPGRKHDLFEIKVPRIVWDTVIDARLANAQGKLDALDGHALLVREKVAAALMILDGRVGMSEEDWELAGLVMQHSDMVRAGTQRAYAESMAQRQIEGKIAAIESDDRAADAVLQKAKDRIVKKLTDAEGRELTWTPLRRSLSRPQQKQLDDAVDSLVEDGLVEVVDIEYQGQPGRKVRLM